MKLIKLDNRFRMKHYGFECALIWGTHFRLQYNSVVYKHYYDIARSARNTLGIEWNQYVNPNGKWVAERENGKQTARIYFRNEKYLTLVQLAL